MSAGSGIGVGDEVGDALRGALAGQRFGTIIADPPWLYQKRPGSKTARISASGTTDLHYDALTNEALAALPVRELAADTAALMLWCTNPGMFGNRFSDVDPEDIARSWGFEYRTMITWVKTTNGGELLRGGMGWYFRGATEHVLFCTRGRVQVPSAVRLPNVILAPRQGHSRKPDDLHRFAEAVLPGPRLELFARRPRSGWSTWGDQIAPGDARDSEVDLS